MGNLKISCSICARGGSKGVKGKNLKLINNLPLIAHTINHAKQTGIFETIAVSSDNDEILEVAEKYGADLMIKRSAKLATDKAPKLPVIQDAARKIEKETGIKFDYMFDLDATSPLRNVEDILGVRDMLISGKYENIITGCHSRRSPYFNLVEKNKEGFIFISKGDKSITRRQDAPETFDMNASIYAWTRESLYNSNSVFQDKTGIFVMPEERSFDIDSEFDFKIINFLLSNENSEVNK